MLTAGERREIASWQGVRRWGLTRFMLFPGVLGWGAGMFVLLRLGLPAFLGSEPPAEGHLGAAVFWSLAGAVWGWFVYSSADRQVARLERRAA